MTDTDTLPASEPGKRRWYTRELRRAYRDGQEIAVAATGRPVIYSPRTTFDPQPWVLCPEAAQDDCPPLRYTGRQCVARNPQKVES